MNNVAKPQKQDIFESFFEKLRAIYPSTASQITDTQFSELKNQWILAFKENGINNTKLLNAGLAHARKEVREFLPSVGRFIQWCYLGMRTVYNIPCPRQLASRVKYYCAIRGEKEFEPVSDAEYYLVTGLYSKMINWSLSEEKLIKHAENDANELIVKLQNGFVIPPRSRLVTYKPEKSQPVNHVRGLKIISQLRSKLNIGNRQVKHGI